MWWCLSWPPPFRMALANLFLGCMYVCNGQMKPSWCSRVLRTRSARRFRSCARRGSTSFPQSASTGSGCACVRACVRACARVYVRVGRRDAVHHLTGSSFNRPRACVDACCVCTADCTDICTQLVHGGVGEALTSLRMVTWCWLWWVHAYVCGRSSCPYRLYCTIVRY